MTFHFNPAGIVKDLSRHLSVLEGSGEFKACRRAWQSFRHPDNTGTESRRLAATASLTVHAPVTRSWITRELGWLNSTYTLTSQLLAASAVCTELKSFRDSLLEDIRILEFVQVRM